jgi:hypothetical protein
MVPPWLLMSMQEEQLLTSRYKFSKEGEASKKETREK